jgi:hypothetical protein
MLLIDEGTGAALIYQERERQIKAEGWAAEHDDAHRNRELTDAAGCYMDASICAQDDLEFMPSLTEMVCDWECGESLNHWPFEKKGWKPSDDPIRNLVKAGALLAAEIDRLQRAAKRV